MSTNFFQQQDQARRNTTRLIVLFLLAVLALIALSYFPVLFFFKYLTDDLPGTRVYSHQQQWALWDLTVLLVTVLLTLSIIGLGSSYKIAQLAGGGKAVALLLGGTEIPTNTRDLRQRRLLNVVEEMAIASGVPVPPVFLLADEPSINAFAAGYAPGDAVVAVSEGALKYLTRDELQGVVAHEFSHILNGDMRLNIRLVGLIHGLVVLSLVGYFLMRILLEGNRGRSRSSNNKGGGILVALFVLGLALYILGSVGAFFGWLIQAAVSRQREFLADASAVQFTRNPDGIAGALKKIGGLQCGSEVKNVNAREVSHMFFASSFRSGLTSLFATHPPLKERIAAIDPHWDGTYPQVRQVPVEAEPQRSRVAAGRPLQFPGLPQVPLHILAPQLAAERAIDRIGTMPQESQEMAIAFEEEITPDIREVLGEPFSARAVIYALLLQSDQEVRDRQMQALRSVSNVRDVDELLRYEQWVRAIPIGTRLAVAHFAMPALRTLSPEQYREFREVMAKLIEADGRVSLFEFCLHNLIARELDRAFRLPRLRPRQEYRKKALLEQAACLLGLLAWEGHDTVEEARNSFAEAMHEWDSAQSVALPERSQCALDRFAAALDVFEQATPTLKQRLIRAAVVCVVANHVVTGKEYALLRVLCASLDCPFPPLGRQLATAP